MKQTFLMSVTVVAQPGDTDGATGEVTQGGFTILESLNLPGDVPCEMRWHYDFLDNSGEASVDDKRGEVYRVSIERVPEADLPR